MTVEEAMNRLEKCLLQHWHSQILPEEIEDEIDRIREEAQQDLEIACCG